ncbi:Uncharacterised protein [Mycobacteroides abscessus subsp. massiliense]|nr:Uncharacterised protein [Mycobacteroides abscessus subsp. massiliense]
MQGVFALFNARRPVFFFAYGRSTGNQAAVACFTVRFKNSFAVHFGGFGRLGFSGRRFGFLFGLGGFFRFRGFLCFAGGSFNLIGGLLSGRCSHIGSRSGFVFHFRCNGLSSLLSLLFSLLGTSCQTSHHHYGNQ